MEIPKSSLMDFFLDKESSDFVVKVKDGPDIWAFPVHSFLLKEYSPVFKTMLDSSFLETTNREITISDFRFIHVKKFLRYLYDSTIPDNWMDLTEVIKIGDKYAVTSIIEKCSERLLLELRIENVFALLAFADQYRLQKLEEKSLELIKQTAFVLLERDDFETLPQQYVEILLSSDDLNIIDELQVLQNAIKWIKFNQLVTNNSTHIPTSHIKMLQFVRGQTTDEDQVKKCIASGDFCNMHACFTFLNSSRNPGKISLVKVSNSLDFEEFSSVLNETKQKNVVHQGLSLTSLESSRVFITGVEIYNDCSKHYINGVEMTNPPELSNIRGQIYSFPKPFVLKRGDTLKYSFQHNLTVSTNSKPNVSFGVASPHSGYTCTFGGLPLAPKQNVTPITDSCVVVPTYTLTAERTSFHEKLQFLCAGGKVSNLKKIFFLKR